MAPVEPLLHDDLVIAARDRAREPELPAATLERALATPVVPRLARYDVLFYQHPLGNAEWESRLIAEIVRNEHRVFLLQGESQPPERHPAPIVQDVVSPAFSSGSTDVVLTALAELRRDETIEAAALFLPVPADPALAAAIRERWGWRIVVPAEAPAALTAAADVRIHFDASPPASANQGEAFLPSGQPWPAKWAALDAAIRATWPRASAIILTHDNLAFTRLCLTSIFANTEYPNYEVIVVDNASTDGTVVELRRLAAAVPNVRLIENDRNVGFGPGNNQGLAAATGEILVLLNNDTIVPRGWLTRLARHLADPAIGLIGPATNRTCNEAQLNPPYQTYAEFQAVARAQGTRHAREQRPIRMLAMFCTVFRRETYQRIGPLDERYEVGMFEDEDYALRVKGAGLEVVWTPEVYVHHAYHASIGKLLPSGEYMRLVELNKGRFEEKWGICWERHRPLPSPASAP